MLLQRRGRNRWQPRRIREVLFEVNCRASGRTIGVVEESFLGRRKLHCGCGNPIYAVKLRGERRYPGPWLDPWGQCPLALRLAGEIGQPGLGTGLID